MWDLIRLHSGLGALLTLNPCVLLPSRDVDLAKLKTIMEEARSPAGMLVVKMKEKLGSSKVV